MEVRVVECAGFCFGVKRAVKTVYELIENGKNIYTYGPVVNNEEVVKDLCGKGVRVLGSRQELAELAQQENAGVVIRAHGVAEEIYHLLEEKGLDCIDATCPFVARIHRMVEQESGNGRYIVIIGDASHPEVEGIVGWCRGPVTVLGSMEEAMEFRLPEERKLFVAAQTTYNYKKFHNIVEFLEKKGYNITVADTICSATEERQRFTRALAAEADVMIVIGGKHSSNTKKLYEICSEECAYTYYIQTLDDLHLELPKAVRLVGITAGASTPNKLIEEVQNYVRVNF